MTDSFAERRNSTFTLEEDSLPLQKLIKQNKAENVEDTTIKDYISKMASEIPDHIFHYDWFQEEKDLSVQFIAIAEKLLPTLILGVEKLLREVEKKGLTEDKNLCPNFNPLNFLAQFMLRNHPRNLSVSEQSAYIKMLQHVTKKVNKQFSSEKKKSLMTMKEQIQQRRLKREATKARCREERLRHKALLVAHFALWLHPDKPQLHTSSVMKALNTLDEMISEPQDEYESLLRDMKTVKEDKTFDADTFSEFLLGYLDNCPITFDALLEHLNKSAEANQNLINDKQERKVLLDLFMICDDSMVGSLDRLQVLSILEEFWLLCPEQMKQDINNPTIWPVTEVEETGMIMGEPSKETTTDSFVVSDGEARDTEEDDNERQDALEDKPEGDELSVSDNINGEDDDITKSAEQNEVDSVTRDVDNVDSADNVSAVDDTAAGDDIPADGDNAAVTDEVNAEDDLDDEEVEEDDESKVKKSSFEYSSEFTSTGAEYSFATTKTEDENYQLVSWLKKVFSEIDDITKSQENFWQEKMAASLDKFSESKESSENIKSLVSFVGEVTVYRDENVEMEPIAAEDGK
uniref:EF-hand domain-containing protein n=1 Tax=Octopus bimaculoides TaxID=37653 RepID=A0A0L8IAA9_OCTBM